MKIRELLEALQPYNSEAEIQVGLSVPELYINVKANLSIGGNAIDPGACTVVRIVSTAPPSNPNASTNIEGPIQEG